MVEEISTKAFLQVTLMSSNISVHGWMVYVLDPVGRVLTLGQDRVKDSLSSPESKIVQTHHCQFHFHLHNTR